MYMSGFLIGVIIAMIYSSYKESRELRDQIDKLKSSYKESRELHDQIDKLKSRQNIYEEKLKSLFYYIKEKN